MVLLILSAAMTGCDSTKRELRKNAQEEFVSGPRGPRKIYVPEYYVYRRGKYQFVDGHYRWVFFRKPYLKRTTRGYTTKTEHASAR
jgi:hypothetical protein